MPNFFPPILIIAVITDIKKIIYEGILSYVCFKPVIWLKILNKMQEIKPKPDYFFDILPNHNSSLENNYHCFFRETFIIELNCKSLQKYNT